MRRSVELGSPVFVAESQRNLGLEERRAEVRTGGTTGRQEVRADAEPFSELAKDLKRRDAGACLDPRYVRSCATLERKISLGQARGVPRLPEAAPDGDGVVYMR
jgi:hypothetical protein